VASDLRVEPASITPSQALQPAAPAPSSNVTLSAFSDKASLATPTHSSLRFELSVDLVVLEFYDASGNVTGSIPSEKQLQAYRVGSATPEQVGGSLVKPPLS